MAYVAVACAAKCGEASTWAKVLTDKNMQIVMLQAAAKEARRVTVDSAFMVDSRG